ncbi:hypothetical protein ACFY2H_35875 [Streptomyces griseofuscus]
MVYRISAAEVNAPPPGPRTLQVACSLPGHVVGRADGNGIVVVPTATL